MTSSRGHGAFRVSGWRWSAETADTPVECRTARTAVAASPQARSQQSWLQRPRETGFHDMRIPTSISARCPTPVREADPLLPTDHRPIASWRADDIGLRCLTTSRQRPARRSACLAVLALASVLGWLWAVPQAEAARAAPADTHAVAAGKHRRVATIVAASPVPPSRTRAASPPTGRREPHPVRHAAKATDSRPAPAAPRPGPMAADAGGVPVGPGVAKGLDAAVRATGIDPALLLAMAWKESRFDPLARNPLSTARGLMQFTEATWLEMVRDFGPGHGLARHAGRLATNRRDGTISASNPRDLARILKLRGDPRLSALMAAERVVRERDGLERALGRAAAPADLYAVHLLGPAGARRFLAELRCAPSRPALEAVGRDSFGANRGVFLARRDGRPLSLAEVHAAMAQAVEEQRAARGGLFAQSAAAAPSMARIGVPGGAWAQVAEAR